jgi:hypothetical protein
MNRVAEIILRAGLLSPNTIQEIKKWGLPVEIPPPPGEYDAAPTAESISRAIADAIEGEGYLLMRETDLEAIPRFLNSMKQAVLHVVLPDTAADIPIQVGRLNEQWLLPWRSDSITDILTNGETHLRFEGKKIFFGDARELFYGSHKAFIVCTQSVEEPDGAR